MAKTGNSTEGSLFSGIIQHEIMHGADFDKVRNTGPFDDWSTQSSHRISKILDEVCFK